MFTSRRDGREICTCGKSCASDQGSSIGASWMIPVGALVLIDAQQGLLEGDDAVPNAAGVLDRLATLLAAARTAETLIVHLQNDGAVGAPDEPGTPGWYIHPKLAPEAGEIVIHKAQDDGFSGTALEHVLAHKGVTRLAVGGLLSEMCVSATVRGAFERELQVVLVHDAHATYDLDDIPAAVVARVAEHALGDQLELADTDEVIFSRR
jgi:streptothricin hydrolase